jgi:hypothetical protein
MAPDRQVHDPARDEMAFQPWGRTCIPEKARRSPAPSTTQTSNRGLASVGED